MKKFFLLNIALVYITACGSSQEINKQDTVTKSSEILKKELLYTVAEKAPILDTEKNIKKSDSTIIKIKSPMQRHDPPSPQIMKVPKPAPADNIEKKTPELSLDIPKAVKETSQIAHSPWNALLKKHVTPQGVVDYTGFVKDRIAFRAYLKMLSTNTPKEDWTINQKLAYWMNAYNAFTVKLIIDNYPLKSIKDLKNPWDIRFFQIGKKWYNLNEIEHQVLRKMGDPRIHFGINCASFSCPPLLNKAFTPDNVDKELEKLAIAFVNDKERNEISTDAIKVSKIFQWFSKDFKTKGALIDFLNQYSETKINRGAKQRFMDYNWDLNE